METGAFLATRLQKFPNGTFPAQKVPKTLWKNFLYLGKLNFTAQSLKNS